MIPMIEIVPYNPEWPALFEVEKSALQAALSLCLVTCLRKLVWPQFL